MWLGICLLSPIFSYFQGSPNPYASYPGSQISNDNGQQIVYEQDNYTPDVSSNYTPTTYDPNEQGDDYSDFDPEAEQWDNPET